MEQDNSNKELVELRNKLAKYEQRYGKFGDVRNFFIVKPTLNDWLTLLMLVGIIIMAIFYMRDIQVCKDAVAKEQVDFNNINLSSHLSANPAFVNNITFKLNEADIKQPS